MKTLAKAYEENTTLYWAMEGLLVLGASLLLAVSAQFSVSLPFSPVPISLQPHAVLFLAMAMGSRRALAAVGLYLLEGALGLPFFAQGGSGLLHLLGPRGGYLMSYLPVTAVVAYLFEAGASRAWSRGLCALLVGNAMILALGTLWLSLYVGLAAAWSMGCYPFLATDLLKDLALLSLMPVVCKRH